MYLTPEQAVDEIIAELKAKNDLSLELARQQFLDLLPLVKPNDPIASMLGVLDARFIPTITTKHDKIIGGHTVSYPVAACRGKIASPSGPPMTALHTWLKADSIVGNDNDDIPGVAPWNDSTGNGHNITVGSNVVLKTGIINGKPVARFDAPVNYLATSAFTLLPQPTTIAVVGKFRLTAGNQYVFDGLAASPRQALINLADANPYMFSGLATNDIGTITADAFFLFVGVFNGASSFGRWNQVQVSAPTIGIDGNAGITLGSRFSIENFLVGDIAEFLLYSAEKTTSEIVELEMYLKGKYGL